MNSAAADLNADPAKTSPGGWDSVRTILCQEVPRQFYDVFFKDLEFHINGGTIAEVWCRDQTIADHLAHRYEQVLVSALQSVRPELTGVKIIAGAVQEEQTVAKPVTADAPYPSQILLNPKYVFDRFVRGPSNEHAFAAALGAAQKPAEFHNPLYLYGGVGLGKTHLMMAIGNYITEHFPWLRVQYTPAEIFQSDLVEAVARKTLPHFKAKYRNVDVLLFDDIQFISQRAEYTQEEIFHTFNYLYQNKKQIVISGDRPPQQLSTLQDRLVSRFQSGLIVDIKPPNLETRLAILQTRSREMDIEVPYEVLKYIATIFKTQIRLLEAALIKLKFTSDIEKHAIDLQMAKLVLKDLSDADSQPPVSIDMILRLVSRSFNVQEEEIKGNSRLDHIVRARHVSMYLARHLIPSMSLSHIAQAFGRNDHTTVIHADRRIQEAMDADEAFRIQIGELREDLQS